ncbi:disks large-associated protein 5 isoform X2 [Tenrec ecaudatus]|uniref:disks large-associated protein 5 isoform X2 n=1 Tax=Tenrec ecaudatus TaxID=94439 RepID=UPI003F599811
MSSSHFASRHRKDLSTDMIRTKIARRKSLSQKENRHKEYERNRHIGLKDSNIPILQGRILAPLEETSQELALEKASASAKPRATKTVVNDQRKQLLHKYKEEKQLQKLKEQREKAKRGVFKVGLYRPDVPGFLLSHSKPTAVKPEPSKAVSSVRITRSRAKEQMDQTKVNNGRTIQAIQPSQRPTSDKKVPDKEKKAVKLVAPTAVRITRSATQATNQITKIASSTTIRKPVSRATNGNELERKSPVKANPVDKGTTFKVENKETTLDLQTSAVNEMDPDGTLSNEEFLPKTNATKIKGKNSFAPKDFVFQPLDGLKMYQAASMLPRRANSFLTPYSWSPLKADVDENEEATKEILAQKCETPSSETVQQDSNPGQWPLGSPAVNKEDDLPKNEDTTNSSNGPPGKEAPSLKMPNGQLSPPQHDAPQHDVPYFRNILQSETEKLTSSCLVWDQKLELDIPDDAKDLIRTTVGQTRLLMKERFKQFEGLVNDCEHKRGEKETTCTDLDGFWDMVSFQIDDVNQKFNNLSKLEESKWQHNTNTSKKAVRKKGVSNTTNKPKQDDGGRIAARNRLAAIKNAMRERMKQEERAETADSVLPKEVDTIVFDAGFFRIESPVKSLSGLSISAERCSQRLRTPKSVSKAVSQSSALKSLLRQSTTLEHSDSQCTKEEHVKTLLSDLPDNRNSVGDDAQSPTSEDILAVNHDANKINFEMDCVPCDRMNLSLLAVEVTNSTKNREEISEAVEGMELNSSIVEQDVLMSSPDKQLPSQSNLPQEKETKVPLGQPVLIDNKSIIMECHLLDSAYMAVPP